MEQVTELPVMSLFYAAIIIKLFFLIFGLMAWWTFSRPYVEFDEKESINELKHNSNE